MTFPVLGQIAGLIIVFFTMCATNLKLCSINLSLEVVSPLFILVINSNSSALDNGSGNTLLEYKTIKILQKRPNHAEYFNVYFEIIYAVKLVDNELIFYFTRLKISLEQILDLIFTNAFKVPYI